MKGLKERKPFIQASWVDVAGGHIHVKFNSDDVPRPCTAGVILALIGQAMIRHMQDNQDEYHSTPNEYMEAELGYSFWTTLKLPPHATLEDHLKDEIDGD